MRKRNHLKICQSILYFNKACSLGELFYQSLNLLDFYQSLTGLGMVTPTSSYLSSPIVEKGYIQHQPNVKHLPPPKRDKQPEESLCSHFRDSLKEWDLILGQLSTSPLLTVYLNIIKGCLPVATHNIQLRKITKHTWNQKTQFEETVQATESDSDMARILILSDWHSNNLLWWIC